MIIIQRRLMLDRLPHLIDRLDRLLAQRALRDEPQRLLDLLISAPAINHFIPILGLQWRIPAHPSVRQLRPPDALIGRDLLPPLKCIEIGGFAVHATVHLAQGFGLVEAAFARRDVGAGFGEEAAGEGRVDVEGDVEAAEGGEEDGFLEAGYGGVWSGLVERLKEEG